MDIFCLDICYLKLCMKPSNIFTRAIINKNLNLINTSFFQINYYFNKKIDTNNLSVNKIISREIEIKN
ncbi:hypothetical protein Catovirus_1_379 [Catovirus CTV1]|uniref:Uncharacterized protein n=1 Tax=Catovirus CTV1 TaxID=1977631 RepID=A0A1V0S9G6_9VIRU|nr:hypothetical protein Catovirus_1_379 [Catovirus CTV1]